MNMNTKNNDKHLFESIVCIAFVQIQKQKKYVTALQMK